MKLDRNSVVLVIIDVQERMMPVIDAAADVERNIDRLIRGCHIIGVPILLTEQYPKGLGATVASVRRALEDAGGYKPIEKSCFSAHGCAGFEAELDALDRTQVLLAGVETHVCVYQTAMDLLRDEYDVTIIADAVSSRTAQNKAIALDRLSAEGVKLSSTEMALFELLVEAGTDEFRTISKLVK
jgi:nicotinamidase-related amidase